MSRATLDARHSAAGLDHGLMPEDITVAQWIAYVFDRKVTDPAWHFDINAPYLKLSPTGAAELISETFEHAGELLGPFSDAQLNQAFWFLVSSGGSDYMFCLSNASVALGLRQRMLRSFIPLFKEVMAHRCSPSSLERERRRRSSECSVHRRRFRSARRGARHPA